MNIGTFAATLGVAAMLMSSAVGCSSDSLKAQPGALPPGTAQLTVNGKYIGSTGAVRCVAIESMTTIKTGDDTAGTSMMLSDKRKPVVEFVRIRSASGFSGDYNLDLDGSADVGLVGNTYHITGTALGYEPTSIAPTTETFAIKVAC